MIEIITPEKADNIFNTGKPYGKFLLLDNCSFTGIDNQTGDAWAEGFKDLKNCLAYLNGADLEDCLELEGYK